VKSDFPVIPCLLSAREDDDVVDEVEPFGSMGDQQDRAVPSVASQIVVRWTRGERRFQPKIQSPRNVGSRKNAASPSIASGALKTLPTYFEYTHQFIPNWDSCTSPVNRKVVERRRELDARQVTGRRGEHGHALRR
jgi:hypothetical protein